MTSANTRSSVWDPYRFPAPASQQEQGDASPLVTPPAAVQRGVTSPSPATNEVSEDEGQRRVGGGESLLEPSDNLPAGNATTTREILLMETGVVVDVDAPPPVEETQGASTRVSLTSHIDVRLTPNELDAIKRRASVLGVKPSQWARAVLRDALDSRRHEVEVLAAQAGMTRPRPELAKAVEQVRRIGVNLNQVVRAGTAVDEDILRDVLDAVREVRALLGDEVSL
ncbi:MobC family plasmid mobilization relaxosome protein [Trueperella pyogenes]|uniref:MobC family plasmid mobilization relaxosome protein n=1 Tax=Trueperella pyogenes TaxID=1661 RepID=UPI001E5A2842|nr:MobC family plasmid mobilization relaxosome protein [Trueperella pyogenes]